MDESGGVPGIAFQPQLHENVVAVNAATANPNTIQTAGHGPVRLGRRTKDNDQNQYTT
jgi:hypothetical protein